MIHINGLKKGYAGKILFENLDLHIKPGDRIALVGENGSGKTTLMKIVSGLEESDAGNIHFTGGIAASYLPQFLPQGFEKDHTLLEEGRTIFSDFYAKSEKASELSFRLGEVEYGSLEYQKVSDRYSQLMDELHRDGFYELDARIRTVYFGLGFTETDLKRKIGEFSGGWQMRILLGKILISRPGVILLDEPTNHLDIEARNWLLDFIRTYQGAVMLVSHDRYFLDSAVNRVAEIYAGSMRIYTGNYSSFEIQREEYIADLHRRAEEYEKTVEKAERFIDRFRAKATKASQVQSRVKMLDRMEKVVIPPARKKIRFKFPRAPHSGRSVIKTTDLGKQYGENIVFMGAGFEIERHDRVAVLGKNGAGKTTLIKILSGKLESDIGKVEYGMNVSLDYYAQEPSEILGTGRSVLEEMAAEAGTEMMPQIRNILGAFLFSDDDVEKKIEVLSGGERSRLALARMLLRKSNLLILDEPTNHLDIFSKEILLDALKYFEGTVIFVSHDRDFIDRLADRILYIRDGELTVFNGDYERYLQKEKEREESKNVRPVPAKKKKGS